MLENRFRPGRYGEQLAREPLPRQPPFRDRRRRELWQELIEVQARYRQERSDGDARYFSRLVRALHGAPTPLHYRRGGVAYDARLDSALASVAAATPLRESTRVLVFDPSGRLLLLNTSDLCDPPLEWWELPGGGVEPGERVEDAARRELREETGIQVESLGPCIARVGEQGWFAGERFEQVESVFAVFLESVPTIAPALVGAVEAQAHLGYEWWYVDDAVASGLRLYPRQLPELASRARRDLADRP